MSRAPRREYLLGLSRLWLAASAFPVVCAGLRILALAWRKHVLQVRGYVDRWLVFSLQLGQIGLLRVVGSGGVLGGSCCLARVPLVGGLALLWTCPMLARNVGVLGRHVRRRGPSSPPFRSVQP